MKFSGHELRQTPGDGERQGELACCSSWGLRVRHDLVPEQWQQQHFVNSFCINYCEAKYILSYIYKGDF